MAFSKSHHYGWTISSPVLSSIVSLSFKKCHGHCESEKFVTDYATFMRCLINNLKDAGFLSFTRDHRKLLQLRKKQVMKSSIRSSGILRTPLLNFDVQETDVWSVSGLEFDSGLIKFLHWLVKVLVEFRRW
ncbi:hypothetical protein Dsin_014945 [Dipteronia sinensis]|uniref:Uncharacterized protein n=1 Tax=Dipteronia sinensis TaxID=43782 RepID=A0AAE0EC23_9ROSI|nr:hypothetical protein Dsin_014945 [Dipteronia sinensis]